MENEEVKFIPSAIGSNADISAGVDIGKVFGGYFSNPKNIESFINIGIEPVTNQLSKNVSYVDFGGGQGQLAKPVNDYLISKGHIVNTTVADANRSYLNDASKQGLNVILCNLESCKLNDLDLITMRAVLHYNRPDIQSAILKNAFDSLKSGGFFVHQVSSGSEENSRLRSAIVNLISLGREGSGNYHWTSIDESLRLHKQAGFNETELAGYAPVAAWGSEEQWDRFNKKIFYEANTSGNQKMLNDLEKRKQQYLAEANKLIKDYLDKFGAESTGIEVLTNGRYLIHYLYPVIVSRK